MDFCKSTKELLDLWRRAHSDEPDITYLDRNIPQDTFLSDGAEDDNPHDAENITFWHKEIAFGAAQETMFSKWLSMLANAIFTENYQTVDKAHTLYNSVNRKRHL